MARVWGNLSDSYRSRLERGGITREAYESGASLSAARGHANTPERPSDIVGRESRYTSYVGARASLVRELQNWKVNQFSGSGAFNAKSSLKAVEKHADGRVRSNSEIRQVIAAIARLEDPDDDYDWEDFVEDVDDALYYH